MRIRNLCLTIIGLLVFQGCGDHDSTGEFEYVALGASDAVGIGASPLTNGYVYRIQDDIRTLGYDVGLTNLGIPGVETDELRKTELPLAVAEEPELVTIFSGANDIVEGLTETDFQNDISKVLGDLSTQTNTLVFVATIPDLTQLPRFLETPDQDVTKARIDSYNQIIRSEAAKSGTTVVELANEPLLSFEVSDDGFHPNDAGHQRIAQAFVAEIRKLLAPNPQP